MKNILGILLIVSLVGISIFSYVDGKANNNDNTIEIIEEIEEDEAYYDTLVAENPRDDYLIDIEGVEDMLNYLDPSYIYDYENILSAYASFLPSCTIEESHIFYDNYRYEIGQILGIYSKDEFVAFVDFIKQSGITHEMTPTRAKLIGLTPSKGLLFAQIELYYDKTYVSVTHVLDYVFIGMEAFLFLYSEGMVIL